MSCVGHYYEVSARTEKGENFVNTYFAKEAFIAVAVARRAAEKEGDQLIKDTITVHRHEEH